MPQAKLNKLSNTQVNSLKGRLLEVRRAGASPIYIDVTKSNTISDCIKKADIPLEDEDGNDMELKVEAKKSAAGNWEVVELGTKVFGYDVIVITTKVKGSY